LHKVHLASVVSYKILPAVLGGQKGIALFCKYISRHAQFTCITTRNNEARFAEGYEVVNVFSTSPLRYVNPFYFFTLRSIIRQKKITHMILEHPYYGWLGILLKWFTGVKLVIHSHNMEGLRWKTLGKWWWKILWHYEKQVHRQADYNFFIQDSDRLYAIQHFRLQPARCTTVTYGIEWNALPSLQEKEAAREILLQRHGIPADHYLLMFNGAFAYTPNLKALERILNQINPVLQKRSAFNYTILICGKDIPASLTSQTYPNVVFAGFVDDIITYFKGTDVFMNPITEGGGIKTKLVEAMGYDLNTVSTTHGAIGIDPGICNGKLQVTDDMETGFAEKIYQLASYKVSTPPEFFEHFYWDNIVKKAVRFIEQ
jgi:glycosyltransferase involved in cell wall biosynthesis